MSEVKNLIISKKIKNIEYKDRFFLFEEKDFFTSATYERLSKTFPKKNLFSSHSEFSRTLNDDDNNFRLFLNENSEWKNIIQNFNSKDFINDLINYFNLKNVCPDNSWKKYLFIFKRVRMSFTFNISEPGGYSLPHTDSSRKLISMVIFFVDKTWNFNNGGQVQIYKPKSIEFEDNWRNKRVEKENLEILKTITPSPNKIYGFKKTKNSYHSVETVKNANNLSRKVFMINLIYSNKSDSPYNEPISIFNKIKNFFKSLIKK